MAARLALDLTLEIGDVQQTVEVTSVAPLLETTTSERGDNVSEELMMTLPLFTGGIPRGNAFTRYLPGVNTSNGQVSVNGSGGRAKEILDRRRQSDDSRVRAASCSASPRWRCSTR